MQSLQELTWTHRAVDCCCPHHRRPLRPAMLPTSEGPKKAHCFRNPDPGPSLSQTLTQSLIRQDCDRGQMEGPAHPPGPLRSPPDPPNPKVIFSHSIFHIFILCVIKFNFNAFSIIIIADFQSIVNGLLKSNGSLFYFSVVYQMLIDFYFLLYTEQNFSALNAKSFSAKTFLSASLIRFLWTICLVIFETQRISAICIQIFEIESKSCVVRIIYLRSIETHNDPSLRYRNI